MQIIRRSYSGSLAAYIDSKVSPIARHCSSVTPGSGMAGVSTVSTTSLESILELSQLASSANHKRTSIPG